MLQWSSRFLGWRPACIRRSSQRFDFFAYHKHLQTFRDSMSRFECNIVSVVCNSKRLLLPFFLSMVAFMVVPEHYTSAQTDSWRRTAKGWERAESWDYLVTAPVGKLKPLTVGTLVQRSWPATFAAAELSVVLLIMHFGSSLGPLSRANRGQKIQAGWDKWPHPTPHNAHENNHGSVLHPQPNSGQ